MKSLASILLFAVVSYSSATQADLTFSAPPRESLAEGEQMYGPIVEYLSESLGQKVKYEHPSDWIQYSVNMRKGKYDIIFDGPHFAAWRIKHLKHSPVAMLPGSLDFDILVRKDDDKINDLRDLVRYKICGLASPNLGTVTVYSLYDNPVVQPEIYEIKGGFKGVYRAFKNQRCRAAIVRDNIYKKLTDAEKKSVKIIYKSRSLPNQTVTVSSKLDSKTRELVAYVLTTAKGAESADKLFGRFSKKEKYFVEPAKQAVYTGLEDLLEGVIWGW
ncbi:MAG: phosphate/phosphite/phosphonate ABC transporter substrate-binding protein [Gammaproteobacteria bacterium]|nr:phosphate/phosphite/phosphonate ABC transporter substrate-binding protein [Gammaproteobacteria bacterium]